MEFLRNLIRLGRYEEIVKLSEEFVNAYPDSPQAIVYISYEIYCLYRLGRYNEALDLAKLHLTDEVSRPQGFILDNLGLVYWKKGDMKRAESYLEAALKIFVKLGDQFGVSVVYNDLGLVKIETGFLSDAKGILEKSLEISREFRFEDQAAYALANLAKIYRMQGRLTEAEEYITTAKETFERYNDSVSLGVVHRTIGQIHEARGERDQAESAFKASLTIRRKVGLKLDIAETLYFLVRLSCNTNCLDADIKGYMEELSELAFESTERRILHYWLMVQGLVSANQRRVFARFQAKKYFEQIINDDRAYVELKVEAIIQNIHLLFLELQISENAKEVIEDIEAHMHLISNFAKWEHSVILEIEQMIIQAKLALIQREFDKSRKILDEARKITEKVEINFMRERVEKEISLLDENLKLWHSALDKNPKIKSSVENNEIVNYLRKIVKLNFS